MRIPKKAKIPIGVVWALLIGVVFITPAIASTDMPLEFDCDCSIEIIGTPELNKPFEAIFTWTPRNDVNLAKSIPDTVRLWHGFENTRYVSGDTLWIGDLQKDQTYAMNARFMAFNPGYCEIRSRIITMRAKGYYYNPYKKVDNGVPAEKICRSNRSFLEDPNKDTTASYKADMKWFYTESGDSFAVGNVTLPENFSIGKPPVAAKAPDNTKAAKRSREITINQPDTNVIYLTQSDMFTKRVITLSSLRTNKIVFPENIKSVELDTTCAIKFEKSSDNVIIIDKPKTECVFKIILDDSTYLVPIRLLSYYTICGTASYVDNNSEIHPCEHADVYLFECLDDECNDLELGGYTTTGSYDGGFCFYADFPLSIVAVYSINEATSVRYAEDHDLSEGDYLYPYNIAVKINNPYYQDVNLSDDYLRCSDLNLSGAFNILDRILACWRYLGYDLQANELPENNVTIWDAQDNSLNNSCFMPFVDGAGIPIIYIKSEAGAEDYDWDEWDEDVIAHEYGHYVMYHYMDHVPEAGGSWNFCFPSIDRNNLNLSFSEAWASIFSSYVWNDPVYINSQTDDPYYTVHNYEHPKPDAPYYLRGDNYYTRPPRSVPQYEGAHVPLALVVSWWDLYDNMDDDNYYEGATLWGHNNDHNGYTYWCGVNEIWDVMTNFDPRPNDAEHNHCWNMYEFIHGWRTFGYPVNQTFKDIFEAHGIPVFIPGDASNDQAVNLLDILRLIGYLYETPPQEVLHLSAGDASGDCTVNMLDILYMISFLYESGSAPLVGCVNLY